MPINLGKCLITSSVQIGVKRVHASPTDGWNAPTFVRILCFLLCSVAYRQFHSTETALLRIKSDLLMAMDQQKVTMLILFNLSAAFDTIVHEILANTLQLHFGIDGTVLAWVKSYLSERHQQIRIDDVVSDSFTVPHGVPQVSCINSGISPAL